MGNQKKQTLQAIRTKCGASNASFQDTQEIASQRGSTIITFKPEWGVAIEYGKLQHHFHPGRGSEPAAVYPREATLCVVRFAVEQPRLVRVQSLISVGTKEVLVFVTGSLRVKLKQAFCLEQLSFARQRCGEAGWTPPITRNQHRIPAQSTLGSAMVICWGYGISESPPSSLSTLNPTKPLQRYNHHHE